MITECYFFYIPVTFRFQVCHTIIDKSINFGLSNHCMKKIPFLTAAIFLSAAVSAQTTTWEKVYDVIQTNCASCHVAGHESGLAMDGTIGEVYDNLYSITPFNATSAAKGYKRVKPGDPYKSFLFSKINNGLALDVNLEAGEGIACPQGAYPLDNKDIELIRQWIIYGAFESDTLVDMDLVTDFYDNDGFQSIASPPAPPAPEDGFQVHFGPFFLWPEDEHEYWLKYYTQLPEDVEIKRLDTYMGDYSHHFITYKYYNTAFAAGVPEGIHNGPEFLGIDLVSANQYTDSLKLPAGTAFSWEDGSILNLNSHYINYSPDKVMSCEVYLNIYTQPVGTAIQIMQPVLLSNDGFWIPNNGLPYTDEATAYENGHGEDELFIWAMSCHTHKYGEDFNIYKRTDDFEKGEMIFDGACFATNGVPGCLDEIYDYKHPPTRYWPEMLPIKWKNGIIYETTWINDGPESVGFGLTSDDEMMVMMYFFVDDTTGLNLPAQPVGIEEEVIAPAITVFPNPASDMIFIYADHMDLAPLKISLTDITGKNIDLKNESPLAVYTNMCSIDVTNLSPGIYLVNVFDEKSLVKSEKIVVQ